MADPTGGTTNEIIATLEREFPRWHVWQGISGLLYARRPLTSPPVVVRGEDAVDLRDQIRGWEGNHA